MFGELFRYRGNLVAFETGNRHGPLVLVLVGGLGDGLLSLEYAADLAALVGRHDGRLLQVLLSSSYRGYGHGSLEQDASELASLLSLVQQRQPGQRAVLLGHSTGCNGILWYLQHHYRESHGVAGTILQGPVSDRGHAAWKHPETQAALEQAAAMIADGRSGDLLPGRDPYGAPTTAYRLHSLLSRLGDDDYFSPDLTDEEVRDKWAGLPPVSINIVFSLSDEYVPDVAACVAAVGRWRRCVPSLDSVLLVPDANHGLDSGPAKQVLCDFVGSLLSRCHGQEPDAEDTAGGQ